MIRFKRIPECDVPNTPHVMVKSADIIYGQAYPCKIQECHSYDSDSQKIYWEWRDIEIVSGDAPDYEEEDR